MRKRNILIVAIILMAVGFAAVTTNLIINGSATIGNNIDDYDIKFTKVILEGIENNSLIIENGKKIKYETKQLINVGDSSELKYEITNNSSQYDAEVSITCAPKGTITHDDLYTFDTKYTPGIIKAKNSATGSIKITLKETTTENIREEFECTLNITAMERTTVGGTIYKDTTLKGTDPVVQGGLIPVKLANDGTVTIANTEEEWYNYGNKEWANAVILVDNPTKMYSVGEVIQESDIESYFVWIPRYRYKLFNANSPNGYSAKLATSIAHPIEIEFESKDETPKTGTKNGEWLTHPAFTNFDTNGIWVGKFEIGYKGGDPVAAAQENSSDPTNIVVKPNVYSWRGSSVGNFFKAMYNYNRDLNSHMIKNTEWGCVAYLSHSEYGINGDIRINNNTNNLTGYAANEKDAAGSATDNQPYNTSTGYLASTTGNITGIYDMSGGSWEYVAAYMPSSNDKSGLTSNELTYYNKYFDIYPSNNTVNSYSNRILGDATGEMGPFYVSSGRHHNNWYDDTSHFIDSDLPWFDRGCGYGCGSGSFAGIFNFNRGSGDSAGFGSRIVLAY